MADIVVTTDFSQVNNLNNSLKATDGLFVKVVDSILREEARARRITKKFAKTTEENLAIIAQAEAIVTEKMQIAADKREKARQREADRAEKEAARIAAAAEKAAKAEEKAAAAREAAAVKATRQAATNRAETAFALGMQKAGELAKQEQEIERLRQKYDSIYAASQIYERSLQELNQAHMLGITSVKQHEAALEALNAEYQAFQNGTAAVNNRFAQGVQQNAVGLNNFGVVTQQVGYQVGDFLVQVQSGTNAFVAFGQQATQLVGFLPMLAENLGIAASRLNVVAAFLSIAIPLTTAIAASFMRASDGAKEAEKAFESVSDAMKGVSDASENLGKIAGESLKVAKEEARAFLEVIQEVRGATLQSALRNAIESTGFAKELAAFETSLRPTQEAIMGGSARAADDMARSMEAFRSSVGLSYQESTKLQNLLRQIGGTTEQEIAQSFFKTVEDLKQMGLLTDEVKKLIAQMADEMGIVDQTFTDVNVSAEDAISKYSKMRTVAAQIANELARVAANTKAAADAALTAMSIEFSPAGQAMAKFGGRGTVSDRPITDQYGDEVVLFGSNRPRRRPNDIDADLPPEVKSRGGRGVDPLESLINQLQTEQETLQNWYTTSQEMLQSASDAELEILGGKYEAMARLDEEYRQRAFEAQQAQAQMSFQAYSGMFSALGDLLSVFGNESKGAAIAALAIQKGLAVAQIVVSTAAAQMRAFAELGPIAGAAMAAKIGVLGKIQAGLVIATGIAQAANIGRGTVGGVGSARGSATVSTQASAPAPQTVMIDSIDPDSLYSGQTLINLFDAFYNENDKRGKVFVVAR